jgi:hypothetical protein
MKLIFWVVVITFVGTIFIAWGMKLRTRSDLDQFCIAEVNGHKIMSYELDLELERLLDQYRSFGFNPNEEQINSYKKMLLDSMIRNHLQEKFAKKIGIYASKNEIAERIKDVFTIKDADGKEKFDAIRYNRAKRYASPAQWRKLEDDIKQSIVLERLRDIFTDLTRVTTLELEHYVYAKEKDTKPEDIKKEKEDEKNERQQKASKYFRSKREDVYNEFTSSLVKTAKIINKLEEKEETKEKEPEKKEKEDLTQKEKKELEDKEKQKPSKNKEDKPTLKEPEKTTSKDKGEEGKAKKE